MQKSRHDASGTRPGSGPGRMAARHRARRRLPLVAALVAGAVLLWPAAPAQAGLTAGRNCSNFVTGDGLRMLSVCSRGYVSPDGRTTNAVVEMHTYRYVGLPYQNWADSRSQSITVNRALLTAGLNAYNFGQEFPSFVGPTCTVNGTSGRFACSVPNVTRLAFYSLAATRTAGRTNVSRVSKVSWRDDRGIAHYVTDMTPWTLGPYLDFNWK